MTIVQLSPLEGTSYHLLQSQSHRVDCWLEGYITVPTELEQKIYACLGNCDLVIDGGVLVDVLPIALPEPTPVPTPDQDRDELIVDLEYRLTLVELGIV